MLIIVIEEVGRDRHAQDLNETVRLILKLNRLKKVHLSALIVCSTHMATNGVGSHAAGFYSI